MSYRYTESLSSQYGKGLDVLVPTDEGKAGLFDCVIVPNLYKASRLGIIAWAKEKGLTISMAKHCDKENTLTHIRPGRRCMVNNFGLVLSKGDPFADGEKDYDVGNGWLKRKTVRNVTEILNYL